MLVLRVRVARSERPTIVAPFRTSNEPSSNLTFGAGGKDKDGNNITGWGYYEVHLFSHKRTLLVHTLMSVACRRSRVVQAPALAGTVQTACTRTLRTRASATSRSWSAAIHSSCTSSGSARALVGRASGAGATALCATSNSLNHCKYPYCPK